MKDSYLVLMPTSDFDYDEPISVTEIGPSRVEEASEEREWWMSLVLFLLGHHEPGHKHPWLRMECNSEGYTEIEWLQYCLDELEYADVYYWAIRGNQPGDECPAKCGGKLKMYNEFAAGYGELGCTSCDWNS
jgi:hypothetical protein